MTHGSAVKQRARQCLSAIRFYDAMHPAMFFTLSKIFWLLAAPSHWLALLVLASILCLLLRWMRAARVLGLLAVLLLVATGMSPLNVWLTRGLENRYSRPPWPTHVDGILILGSGFDTMLLRARRAPETNSGAYRLVEGMAAARRYPAARVVFSGGSGALGGALFSEAETARYVMDELGLDPHRLTLEARSRNTYENILFSKAMVQPRSGQVWLLVTSATHMPRAMAVARRLNWPMVAWPSDYITAPHSGSNPFDIAGNLGLTDYALHEWIGMLVYRLSGKAL
jgi:uncharacterized SAM-binding protein YcdF (DUF218 family)